MLIIHQWLAEALLPSLVAFYFAWAFLGRRDGEAVPIRWWWYGLGMVATLFIAVTLRQAHLVRFGGELVLDPSNWGILYVYVLMPAGGALIAVHALLELPNRLLTRADRPASPDAQTMQLKNKPDLHWKNWSGWLLLLYGVALMYVNVRPTQRAELIALGMVLVLVGVPLILLYAWKGFRPRSNVRPLLGAFTTGSVLLGLAVLGELPRHHPPSAQPHPALASASPANATRPSATGSYLAVPAQESSEEYMDRMFAEAVDRFFADEQNSWILRDEIKVRFERHISDVFNSEPTLNYDDLLVRARTALENELGDVSPAEPAALIDPTPKRGCSYRGVMTDAEIAECRRQGHVF